MQETEWRTLRECYSGSQENELTSNDACELVTEDGRMGARQGGREGGKERKS